MDNLTPEERYIVEQANRQYDTATSSPLRWHWDNATDTCYVHSVKIGEELSVGTLMFVIHAHHKDPHRSADVRRIIDRLLNIANGIYRACQGVL